MTFSVRDAQVSFKLTDDNRRNMAISLQASALSILDETLVDCTNNATEVEISINGCAQSWLMTSFDSICEHVTGLLLTGGDGDECEFAFVQIKRDYHYIASCPQRIVTCSEQDVSKPLSKYEIIRLLTS